MEEFFFDGMNSGVTPNHFSLIYVYFYFDILVHVYVVVSFIR